MKADLIRRLHGEFEEIVRVEQGAEFWLARDLSALLGYSQWRNFVEVVEKAKVACEASGQLVVDHFADVGRMVLEREIGIL